MSPLLLLTGIRPILLALLLRPFDLFRRHHNHSSVLLPHHVPEVDYCVRQTALRRDVRLRDEVVVAFRVCHRGHGAEVAAHRRQRLGTLVLVVVTAGIDRALDAHFVQQLTVDALAVVVRERRVRSLIQVLERGHRVEIRIGIALQRSDVVGVDVLSAG